MQPISDLLHRIRWDAEFGKGTFAIGYWDRVAGRELIVPFASIAFDAGSPGLLLVEDTDSGSGPVHLPLHRVRAVYKDGAEIWRRPAHAGEVAHDAR